MRSWSRPAVSSALLVLLIGCMPGTVELAYRFDQPRPLIYDWTVEAVTRLDTPSDQGTTTVRLEARVEQSAVRRGVDSLIRLRIVPIKAMEDGRETTTPPPTTIDFEATRRGTISKVAQASGVSALGGSTPEIGNQLTESLPLLPPHRVGIGDEWEAPLRVTDTATEVSLAGRGRLDGFDLQERRRLARISLRREGTVSTEQRIARTEVILEGPTRVRSTSLIDVDAGIVFSTQTSTRTSVNLLMGGGSRGGTMEISVESKLRLRRTRSR